MWDYSTKTPNSTRIVVTQEMLNDSEYSRTKTDGNGCYQIPIASNQGSVLCVDSSFFTRCAVVNSTNTSVRITGSPRGIGRGFEGLESFDVHLRRSEVTPFKCRAEVNHPDDLELREVGYYITSSSASTFQEFVNITEFNDSLRVRQQIASYTDLMESDRTSPGGNCVPGVSCTRRANNYWLLAKYAPPETCEEMLTYSVYLTDELWSEGMELITYVAATKEVTLDHRVFSG